jgi:hypothetical protein
MARQLERDYDAGDSEQGSEASLPTVRMPSEITDAEWTARVEQLRRLLDAWTADESGYEDEAWPELKSALDQDRLSYRKLFVD